MLRRPSSLAWITLGGLIAASLPQCGSGADDPPTQIGKKDEDAGFVPDGNVGGTGGIVGVDVPGLTCTDETDTDGDMIADEIEGSGDSDGDGTPDREDTDSDDDGIPDEVEAGPARTSPCSDVLDTDGTGGFDFQDPDADDDGLPDADEDGLCPNVDCRVLVDCDSDPDGVIDLVELAAMGDPCDGMAPPDAGLYFVVPFQAGEQRKKFDFSTGVKDADVYFLIDTTNSMQPAIDNIKSSLDSSIIPTILNGDATATPEIPAIPGAWIGIGDFKDVPWAPWGIPGDRIYGFKFDLGADAGGTVYGNMSPPNSSGGVFTAPDNVRDILNSLAASGGGDSPEAASQALFLASTNEDYRAVGGGEPWPPNDPPGSGNFDAAEWRKSCDDASKLGRACFRPGKLPIFVIVTDAGFHNGPTDGPMPAPNFDYVVPPAMPPSGTAVNGTRTYEEVLAAMNQISAKIVGVSVDTGTPGQARADLIDLAEQTGSKFFDAKFGGSEKPLVTEQDTSTGDVSAEVVRLIGLLAGQGLNNVTTVTNNYDCQGGVDCTGDGSPDPEYHNFTDAVTSMPFDAAQLIKSVDTVESTANPLPYASRSESVFFGVRGDATVEFEVVADNQVLNPSNIVVVRAILRVQTPTGLALGGADGVKVIYLVVPPFIPGVQ